MFTLSLLACAGGDTAAPKDTDTASVDTAETGDSGDSTVDSTDTQDTVDTSDTSDTSETGDTDTGTFTWNPFSWSDCAVVRDVGEMSTADSVGVSAAAKLGDQVWYNVRGDEGVGRIAHSVQTDSADPPGFTWDAPTMAVDGHDYSYDEVGGPAPLAVPDAGYSALYFGARPSGDPASEIVRCTTTDGFTMTDCTTVLTKDDAGDEGAAGVAQPFVTQLGDLYRMWFVGVDADGARHVLSATSEDGLTFASVAVVLDQGAGGDADAAGVGEPMVFPDAGGYRLFYAGTAEDGTKSLLETYTESPGGGWRTPLGSFVAGCEGTSDAAGVDAPWVWADDTGPRLFYAGSDADGITRILVATGG